MKNLMRIAFVNCWTMPGGVLNVLQDLLQKTLRKEGNGVEIQLFTLISEFKSLEIMIPGGKGANYQVKVIQALPNWINQLFLFFKHRKVPILSGIFDYRNLMVFYPQLMKLLSGKIKRWKPDQIQISSFAIAKNIDPIPGVPTHLYLHSPMQYIWTHHEEYQAKFTGWKRKLFDRIVPKLRNRDQHFTSFTTVRSNSVYTQQCVREIYGIDSEVSYPKVSDAYRLAGISSHPKPYFVCVGRVVNFVRECGLIIELFNRLQLPLLMIGSGPDEEVLKAKAGPTVIFTGRMEEGLVETIRDSAGLINLTKESFGIGTVEALLMGVPVFAFAEGASSELVGEESGMLTGSKDLEDLLTDFKLFLERKWDRKLISEKIREKLLNH